MRAEHAIELKELRRENARLRKLSGIRDLTEADVLESVRAGATYPIVLCLSEKEAAAVNRALRSEMAVWRDAVTETGTLLNDVLNRLLAPSK